jgi:hypothetical protein
MLQVGILAWVRYAASWRMNLFLYDRCASGKRLRAIVCLIAVLLLWSPAWAVNLQANGIGCCDGPMCPVHGNSPMHHGPSEAPSDKSAQPMRCDHSGGSSMMNCGMSRCLEQPQFFGTSIQFVLPPAGVAAPAEFYIAATSIMEVQKVLQSFDPLSPPPRSFLL